MGSHLDERECRLLGEFFTIFASPTRLRIFCALQEGPRTVSDIAEEAGVTIQNVSQHLRIMRDKGGVETEKAGQYVYYKIVDKRLLRGAQLIRDALVDALERKAGVGKRPLNGIR